MRVAMKSREQLMQWLKESGREFIIFNTKDLMDSLPHAQDAELLQQLIGLYATHRMSISYDKIKMFDPISETEVEAEVTKDERLTLAEMDRLVRKLAGAIKDQHPEWSLDGDPIG